MGETYAFNASVIARSYSRGTGATSDESSTRTSGHTSSITSRARCSCVGLT